MNISVVNTIPLFLPLDVEFTYGLVDCIISFLDILSLRFV